MLLQIFVQEGADKGQEIMLQLADKIMHLTLANNKRKFISIQIMLDYVQPEKILAQNKVT